MRVLVTGSRNWTESWPVEMAIYSLRFRAEWSALTIVHGGAEGADALADYWAETYGIRREPHYPQDHRGKGKPAPLARNDHMLDSGIDLVLAFMLGTPERGGTLYTVNGAKMRGLPLVIFNWPGDPVYRH
jgi:hypothetical protein